MIQKFMLMSKYEKNNIQYVQLGCVDDYGVKQFPFPFRWLDAPLPEVGEVFDGDVRLGMRFSSSGSFVTHDIQRVNLKK